MLWIIAARSAIGGAGRYLVGTLVQRMIGGTFPFGTLVVNITGSLAIGVLMRWSLDASHSAELRAFLTVGLRGGYTTSRPSATKPSRWPRMAVTAGRPATPSGAWSWPSWRPSPA